MIISKKYLKSKEKRMLNFKNSIKKNVRSGKILNSSRAKR